LIGGNLVGMIEAMEDMYILHPEATEKLCGRKYCSLIFFMKEKYFKSTADRHIITPFTSNTTTKITCQLETKHSVET